MGHVDTSNLDNYGFMFFFKSFHFILWPTPKARKRTLFFPARDIPQSPASYAGETSSRIMHLLVILFLLAILALLGGLGLLSANTTSTAAAEW